MKRIAIIILAAVLVFALFAGCGGTGATTPAPTTTDAAGGSQNTPAPGGNTAEPDKPVNNTPYNLAVDPVGNLKYEVDSNGFPVSPYEYELPLTTSNEVLTYFTVCWIPDRMPPEANGNYTLSPYPEELKRLTGVNIEYDAVTQDAIGTSFNIRVASDELADIMSYPVYLYTEKPFREAVLSEQLWINIYDYKDYCPNYIYQAVKDPNDIDTIERIFAEPELILTFYMLWDQGTIQQGLFARGEWLKDYGKTADELKTVDDINDFLKFCKVSGLGYEYPTHMESTLDRVGLSVWTCYDTFSAVNSGAYVINGKIQWTNTTDRDLELAKQFKYWVDEDLVDPTWQSYVPGDDLPHFPTGYALLQGAGNTAQENDYKFFLDYPTATIGLVPVARPLRNLNQVDHIGGYVSRVFYGNTTVSQTCRNIPLAVTWMDFKFSDAGMFVNTYGVEGISFEFDDKGIPQFTDFMVNHPSGESLIFMMTLYSLNELSDAGLRSNLGRWRFPGSQAELAYKTWGSVAYDGAYRMPASVTLNEDQTSRLNIYSADVSTYISENFIQFVSGEKPLSEYDAYVASVKAIGADAIIQIYQEAYDYYIASQKAIV